MEDGPAAMRELRDALRQPIATVDEFTFLLSKTLHSLDLLPTSTPSGQIFRADKQLSTVQQDLLTTAVPTFLHALDERGRDLLDIFFSPKTDSAAARAVAVCSYTTLPALLASKPGILALPLASREYVLDILADLGERYGIIAANTANEGEGSKSAGMRQMKWEETVKAIVSLPAKVGNAVGAWRSNGWTGVVPVGLEPRPYFDRLVRDLATLLIRGQDGDRIRYVIERLVAVGLLVPKATKTPLNTPSFFPALLPAILPHLEERDRDLSGVILGLPSSALYSFVDSLLAHLVLHVESVDQHVSIGIRVLQAFIGPAKVGNDAWDAVVRSIPSRMDGVREEARNRIIVGWASTNRECITSLIDAVLEQWTDAKWIRYTLYSAHFHQTHLLLLCLGQLPPYHPFTVTLATSGRFIMACQSYLGHPDASVRRLGLLVAEMLSEMTIPNEPENTPEAETEELMQGLEGGPPRKGLTRLRFGKEMWEGEGDGREEARWLRGCVGVRDREREVPKGSWSLGWDRVEEMPARGRPVSPRPTKPKAKSTPTPAPKTKAKPKAKPKVIMLDDDDPLSGYSSPSATSSRSASPTPSYLEEVTNDPTLALDSTKKKKVQRPVYIPQLLALLRDKDPDAIEMGLEHGEALVRAKRNFGTELAENAMNLIGQLVGMNDPYNIEHFEERRDGLARAVVACAPRQAAPYIIELYFTNQYSLQQKSTMLGALAMGARELAGLHIPEAAPHSRRIDFPTRTLPLQLHQRYFSVADETPRLKARDQIDLVTDEIRGLLLSKGARRAEEVPEIAREKRLRVGPTRVQATEVVPKVVVYGEVAAEFFVLPLINRFWQHFQDASAREIRASASGSKYRGAGTGMLLSPLALERFIMTLSLLVHAARHASVFLAVIVPEALELAVTLGSRHLARPDDYGEGAQDDSAEAQVLGTALELALVCLDGAWEMDQGRTLVMDKADVLFGAGEWAQGVFETESAGGKVAQGQAREGKLRAAAAGVVVKVAEIGEKWHRR